MHLKPINTLIRWIYYFSRLWSWNSDKLFPQIYHITLKKTWNMKQRWYCDMKLPPGYLLEQVIDDRHLGLADKLSSMSSDSDIRSHLVFAFVNSSPCSLQFYVQFLLVFVCRKRFGDFATLSERDTFAMKQAISNILVKYFPSYLADCGNETFVS